MINNSLFFFYVRDFFFKLCLQSESKFNVLVCDVLKRWFVKNKSLSILMYIDINM